MVVVMVMVMVMVVGRMMVSLAMRTMVVSAVSIAGQEADQNQGQGPNLQKRWWAHRGVA